VDLPGILDHKLGLLEGEPTVCRYEAVRVDLRDAARRQALFSQLGSRSKGTLVVAEGLLVYLTPQEVGELVTDLHAPASFEWFLIDIASPQLLKIMRKYWGRNVDAGNAPFQFAPAESTKFFAPFGWREVAFRSSMEEAERLHREMPMMWLWRFLGRFRSQETLASYRRFSGFALLQRT
jgi:O-methyltransferase involved in polyketide biosynthesis